MNLHCMHDDDDDNNNNDDDDDDCCNFQCYCSLDRQSSFPFCFANVFLRDDDDDDDWWFRSVTVRTPYL